MHVLIEEFMAKSKLQSGSRKTKEEGKMLGERRRLKLVVVSSKTVRYDASSPLCETNSQARCSSAFKLEKELHPYNNINSSIREILSSPTIQESKLRQ